MTATQSPMAALLAGLLATLRTPGWRMPARLRAAIDWRHGMGKTEGTLRRAGAALLLVGAVALGLQVLISLAWVPGAVVFILVISGPQLVAGIWILLPWRRRRSVLYLPAILLAVFVAYWNIAILLEPAEVPDVPPLVLVGLLTLLGIQALFPVLAAGALVWAWRVGGRTSTGAAAPA